MAIKSPFPFYKDFAILMIYFETKNEAKVLERISKINNDHTAPEKLKEIVVGWMMRYES